MNNRRVNEDNEKKSTSKNPVAVGQKLSFNMYSKTNFSRFSGAKGDITRNKLVIEVKRGVAVKNQQERETVFDQEEEHVSLETSEISRRINALKKAKEEEVKRKILEAQEELEIKNQYRSSEEIQQEKSNLEMDQEITISQNLKESDSQENNQFSEKNSNLDSKRSEVSEIEDDPQSLLKEKKKIPKNQEPHKTNHTDTKRKHSSPIKLNSAAPKTSAVVPSTKTRLKKSHLASLIDDESGDILEKRRSLASFKRSQAKSRRNRNEFNKQEIKKIYKDILILEKISVGDLASKLSELAVNIIKELKNLGIYVKNNDFILSPDVAELVSVSLGHKVRTTSKSVEDILTIPKDLDKDLKTRPPVVTIMGHVDHGKTSLLDFFRSSSITSLESGGITQHIGAYSISVDTDKYITFLDTPGHAAFSEIRQKGSNVTDITVLMIAADDGIKPQTIESINLSKSSNVPIIVAINKIDKEGVNIDKIKQDLLQYDLISEDFGGDTIIVPISVKEKKNLDKLAESILLLSEIKELRARYDVAASGVVLESRVDYTRGFCSTLLVQRGSLKKGDLILAGTSYCRVRWILDDASQELETLDPSFVGVVFGFDSSPSSGEKFYVLESEKKIQEIIEHRKKIQDISEKDLLQKSNIQNVEDLFSKHSLSKKKEITLIIKVDAYGSIDAIKNCLKQIQHEEVKLKLLSISIGNITISDINHASIADAIIIGFNVKIEAKALSLSERNSVLIQNFSNVYQIIDKLKSITQKMLSPILKEVYTGSAEVRKVFEIKKVGKIAGCYITDGIIETASKVNIIRDTQVVHEDFVDTIQQLKTHVKEIRAGLECGITLKKDFDFRLGDIIKVFKIVHEERKL